MVVGGQAYANSVSRSRTSSIKAVWRAWPAAISAPCADSGPLYFSGRPDKFGERAAGFVHQKVGSRKVPIMTAA